MKVILKSYGGNKERKSWTAAEHQQTESIVLSTAEAEYEIFIWQVK